MKYSETVKPISYLEANAAQVIQDVVDKHKTMIITQNGEAKVVLQDIRTFEQLQDSLALLKILALSNKSLKADKVKEASQSFNDIRTVIDERRSE